MWNHGAKQFETCDDCRFNAAAYTIEDVNGTLGNIERMVRFSVRGVDTDALNVRPTPRSWSANEYIRHMKGVVKAMRFLTEAALTSPGTDLDGAPPADAAGDDDIDVLDADHEINRLLEESLGLWDTWTGLDADGRGHSIVLNGQTADIAGILRHCAHELLHHLSDLGRTVAAVAPIPLTGIVESIHAGKGVPKPAIDSAAVGYRGIDIDTQRIRKHHGRVWQSMCLWSGDVIDSLQAEGHPVFGGSCGENLVLRGVDWAALRSGMRVRFDSGLEVELTDFASPCKTIAESFTDRNFRRIDDRKHPGVSRVYARTVTDGVVATGDRFVIE